MTTFESTVAMMRQLPEEDLLVIQSLVRRLVNLPSNRLPKRNSLNASKPHDDTPMKAS